MTDTTATTKSAKPAKAAKPATEAPAAEAPAKTKTAKPNLDGQKITVLVQDPKLRGTRAERWPLVLASKTRGELAQALKDGGYKNPVGGMLKFMVERGLVRLG
ncbi:hypothetical protein [Roseomonas sp. CECT 9278]|uniref:hypothetical protein n=1 Tax=Roseomonas sp. CECT 9278 TaxID=2845823 RepID=UPI001E330445|nr:hypothetical protein [Roseomonas sp. CECT 9278]CAH0134328.1 hypothetical protein ROS9278_00312 [Roseomonas sp. CECT 9278]